MSRNNDIITPQFLTIYYLSSLWHKEKAIYQIILPPAQNNPCIGVSIEKSGSGLASNGP